jgi:biopolymer transport protein ExbB
MGSDLFSSLGTGGPVVLILFILSMISVAIILAKTIQLSPVSGGKKLRKTAFDQWSVGEHEAAQTTLAGGKSPADRVTAFAMDGTMRKLPRSSLEAEVQRRGNAEVENMSRHIRLLELVAMIAPLLGLLGTVLGMIQSFQGLELAQGAAKASVLAGGIWQALLTTAAGLIVAIPAAIAATLLTARVDSAAFLIESAVGYFFLTLDSEIAV